MDLSLRLMDSPLGTLRLVASPDALCSVSFPSEKKGPLDLKQAAAHPILDQAQAELVAYFAGERQHFATPLAPTGTDFQCAVWRALLSIPFGQTRSYGQIAASLSRPAAVRAVGAANGKNPLPLFIPCHRVIGADGKLTGFAGGLPAKRWLLDHERRPALLPFLSPP